MIPPIPYDVQQAFAALGIHALVSQDEAKRAYRSLAMRWHPDINKSPEADARMKAINVAFEVVTQHISQRARTQAFTRTKPHTYAHAYANPFASSARPRARPTAAESKPAAPAVVVRAIRLNLKEAAFGCTKRMEGPTWSVDVQIHPGVLDGAAVPARDVQVRVFADARPTQFRFTVQLEKHPVFRLEKDRLSVTVPISVWRMVLGEAILVPTLEGSMRVPLPERPGCFLVKGQGWPDPQRPGVRKPLFVMPKIIYPTKLEEADRRVLEALDAQGNLPEVQNWEQRLEDWLASAPARGSNPNTN